MTLRPSGRRRGPALCRDGAGGQHAVDGAQLPQDLGVELAHDVDERDGQLPAGAVEQVLDVPPRPGHDRGDLADHVRHIAVDNDQARNLQ